MTRDAQAKLMNDLRVAVDAVCPNEGVWYGTAEEPTARGYHPKAEATVEQRAAAEAALAAFDPSDYEDDGEAGALENVLAARRSAYPPMGDQLDALMKGLDAVSAEITLPAETLAWITACKAVKTNNPKGS